MESLFYLIKKLPSGISRASVMCAVHASTVVGCSRVALSNQIMHIPVAL